MGRQHCGKCGKEFPRKRVHFLVLEEIEEKGGWVSSGFYCRKCVLALERIMEGKENA